jgi:hypothetical protein
MVDEDELRASSWLVIKNAHVHNYVTIHIFRIIWHEIIQIRQIMMMRMMKMDWINSQTAFLDCLDSQYMPQPQEHDNDDETEKIIRNAATTMSLLHHDDENRWNYRSKK